MAARRSATSTCCSTRTRSSGRLIVAGIDGHGCPYRTEVIVFRENRYNFKATNAVYWSNFVVIETNDFGPDDGCPAAECFNKRLDKKADERLGRG